MKVSILTKGGSRPSGIDADGWRRILTSHDFGTAQLDLGKTFTQLIKRFCVEEPESASYLGVICGLQTNSTGQKTWDKSTFHRCFTT